MPIKRLGGDEPLPRPPADRGRQGTTLGVAPAPVPSVQVCTQCRNPAPSDGRFCGECGGSIFADAQVPVDAPSQVAASVSPRIPSVPVPVLPPAPAVLPASAPAERLPPPTRGGRTRPKGIGTLMGEDMEARIKLAEEARGFKIFLGCLILLAVVILAIWVITSTPSRSSARHPSGVSISVPLADASTED